MRLRPGAVKLSRRRARVGAVHLCKPIEFTRRQDVLAVVIMRPAEIVLGVGREFVLAAVRKDGAEVFGRAVLASALVVLHAVLEGVFWRFVAQPATASTLSNE